MTLTWQPTPARVADSRLFRFIETTERTHAFRLPDRPAPHRRSVDPRAVP